MSELGDAFSMYISFDQHQNAATQQERVMVSPGAALPAISPATINWLQQSLSANPSAEVTSASANQNGGFCLSPFLPLSSTNSATNLDMMLDATNSASLNGLSPHESSALTPGSFGDCTAGGGTIDWKAFNELNSTEEEEEDKQISFDENKWKEIPQYGNKPLSPPSSKGALDLQHTGNTIRDQITAKFHAITNTVTSMVSGTSIPNSSVGDNVSSNTEGQSVDYSSTSGENVAQPLPQHPNSDLYSKDNMNKRKAVISPEFEQFGTAANNCSRNVPENSSVGVNREPNGMIQAGSIQQKRPSKKIQNEQSEGIAVMSHATDSTSNHKDIRCKCTGKCRNARCVCVKAGKVCGEECRCKGCANPLVPMMEVGLDPSVMCNDACLMQNLSKIKNMRELLGTSVKLECCGSAHQLSSLIPEFTCKKCQVRYKYSWCGRRLCNEMKKPRKHCDICKRCGDHRNQHCHICGHCYFAGVANSFSCSNCPKQNNSGNNSVDNYYLSQNETQQQQQSQSQYRTHASPAISAPTSNQYVVSTKISPPASSSPPVESKSKAVLKREEEANDPNSCPVQ